MTTPVDYNSNNKITNDDNSPPTCAQLKAYQEEVNQVVATLSKANEERSEVHRELRGRGRANFKMVFSYIIQYFQEIWNNTKSRK